MNIDWVIVVACAILGLVIGSFLTVVVDRVPDGRSIIRPGSECAECGHRLGPADLIPVASWLRSRGRCRHCGVEIGSEPLLIEIATAVVFALMGWRFQATPALLVPYLVLGAALVALSAIDLRVYRLPREISYTALALSFAAMVGIAAVESDWQPVRTGVIGAGVALATLGLVYVASRGEMGSGDVRLSPLLGLHLGYLGIPMVPIGLFTGFLSGAIVGVAGLLAGRVGRKSGIPFGPHLALGTLITVWWGEWIAAWLGPLFAP